MDVFAPTDRQTVEALRTVAGALDATCAYWHEGRFWFPVADTWALAVSPDDAGRFRLSACYGTEIAATLWATADDARRLADLARSLKAEAESLATS